MAFESHISVKKIIIAFIGITCLGCPYHLHWLLFHCLQQKVLSSLWIGTSVWPARHAAQRRSKVPLHTCHAVVLSAEAVMFGKSVEMIREYLMGCGIITYSNLKFTLLLKTSYQCCYTLLLQIRMPNKGNMMQWGST